MVSATFDQLHGELVPLGRLPRGERSKESAPASPGMSFPRVKSIQARRESANHDVKSPRGNVQDQFHSTWRFSRRVRDQNDRTATCLPLFQHYNHDQVRVPESGGGTAVAGGGVERGSGTGPGAGTGSCSDDSGSDLRSNRCGTGLVDVLPTLYMMGTVSCMIGTVESACPRVRLQSACIF
jgi:hypothetical protein